MPGDEEMKFDIGKYHLELTRWSLSSEDTQTGERYSCGLLNGYEAARNFLGNNPTQSQLCVSFDFPIR